MEVVIFVGGLGMRMSSAQRAIPKVLHELGGRPILVHVMDLFRAAGHRQFILPLGYRGDDIARYFVDRPAYLDSDFALNIDGEECHARALNGRREPLDIKFVRTGIETGKGERLRRVADELEGDTFFATYGDGLADIDLEALLEFHLAHGKAATLTAVRTRSQFGHVAIDEAGAVTEVVEKPPLPGWINAGFFVFQRRIFDYLQPDDELEPDCFPRLAQAGELAAFTHEGFWACMDTDKDYVELDQICRAGRPPWVRG